MFLHRSLSRHLARFGQKFPVVMVTGARQVGKSTLLRRAYPDITYVSLDDPEIRLLARTEPKLFLARYKPPVIIDEVQYAPELFPLIKAAVDESGLAGQYWLSGSQQFHLMKNVSESLAGRIGILQLAGLSTRELMSDAEREPVFDRLDKHDSPVLPVADIFERIWRGSYPALHMGRGIEPDEFYPGYVQTYLERDVRDLARVGDERAFMIFMRLAAARTGQLLNVLELANAADVSVTAARAWLSILEASGVVIFLSAFHTNASKRLVKAPKLYFVDTGLAAWLAGWSSPEALERGASAGAYLETYVVGEVIKSYWHAGLTPQLWFYRDHDGREVDLLLVRDETAFGIEVKATSRPDPRLARSIMVGERLGLKQGPCAVACLTEEARPLAEGASILPVGTI